MTDQATGVLDEIRALGWQIVSEAPAALEVTGRDRLGAPATYAQRDGYYSAERVTPRGQRLTESSHSPEQLLEAIKARDAHVQRLAGGSQPPVHTGVVDTEAGRVGHDGRRGTSSPAAAGG